ncbi:MAG: TRAP transporter substrate-binding protein DctP [Candidatus Marinimicrobia bacterium]|nr:TRAP transporter substrate-binding protein DctP [Candidatus Neomarinimicrobiota bacterium]
MNKVLIYISILLMLTDLSFARKTIIKMATLAPEGTPWYSLIAKMGERWTEETNGNVRLRIYPGGIVGDERDMIRKMKIGQIHGAAISAEGLTEINPQYTYCFIPLLFQEYGDIDYIRDQIKGDLISGAEKNGVKVLTMVDVGWVYWFTTNPIFTPQDLKSQKIWTWAGDYKTAKLYDEAGFNAVPLAVPDVHSSLQTGLVNAMPFPPLYVAANQYFGITKNMLNMKWGILTAALVIDLKIWNKIKPKYQKTMLKVSEEIGIEYQLNNRKEEDDAVEVMKEYGLKVNNLNQGQVNEWNELVESMYPLIRGNIVQEEIFDRVMDLKSGMPSMNKK